MINYHKATLCIPEAISVPNCIYFQSGQTIKQTVEKQSKISTHCQDTQKIVVNPFL